MQFTDVLTEFLEGGEEYADVEVDSFGKGLPYTIYRDDVAIATGITEYGLAGSMWFTDYDVVPGETYKYEIKVKGEDVDSAFGPNFCADVTNKQEYTTGPLDVTCYFIHTAELESDEVLFDGDGGDRDFGVAIYKKTADQTIREDRPGYWMSPDADWIGVRDTTQLDWQRSSITISVDENDTGAAREGIITIGYQGFEWQIKVRQSAKGGSVDPAPTPEQGETLYDSVVGEVPSAAASEYNGYLVDAKGNVEGTIQVKVGKPGKKDGAAAVKANVVVGAKKVSLKAAEKGKAVIASDGPTAVSLVGGEACEVVLGADGLSGSYGAYTIDGARNLFTSKDKGEQGDANAVLGKWLGSVNVVWDGGSVNVSIANKGKAKVKGTLADGKTKVSANAVFLVGEEWCCVPVVAPKASLSFAIWLSRDGRDIEVTGLGDDVLVGAAGSLPANAKFRISKTDELWAEVPGKVLADQLPDGVPVMQSGTRWTLPKAGKVAYVRGTTEVDEAKLQDNPSGLKLTYKAKDGSFKGSFKVYADNGGRLKATTVNVTGVMVGGKGYGTATIKNVGSVDVTIE